MVVMVVVLLMNQCDDDFQDLLDSLKVVDKSQPKDEPKGKVEDSR